MMRWLGCLSLVACRIGFDEVVLPDAGSAATRPICSGTVCAATCPIDTRCEIDCAGSTECAVDCDGPCTVTHCEVGPCVVQCGDTLAERSGDVATCR